MKRTIFVDACWQDSADLILVGSKDGAARCSISSLGFLILLAQLAQASIVDVVIGIVFHTFE